MVKKILIVLILTLPILSKSVDSNSSKEYILEIKGIHHLNKSDIAKALGVKDNDIWTFWKENNKIKEEFVKNLEPTLKGYLETILMQNLI